MKAREYLVSKGLAKPGRGKFSTAGIAELNAALGRGQKFTDYPKSDVVVTKPTGEPVKVESADSDIPYIPEYRYAEDAFVAIEVRDGKRVERSLRSACNHCRKSLVVCWCPSPIIVAHDGNGSVPVTIERV